MDQSTSLVTDAEPAGLPASSFPTSLSDGPGLRASCVIGEGSIDRVDAYWSRSGGPRAESQHQATPPFQGPGNSSNKKSSHNAPRPKAKIASARPAHGRWKFAQPSGTTS